MTDEKARQSESLWVDVKDALPDINEGVLGCTDLGMFFTERWENGEGRLLDKNGFSVHFEEEFVSHWMRIAPPKGKEIG